MTLTNLITLPALPAWMNHAACSAADVDRTDFYPRKGDTGAVRRAKTVCSGCPVTVASPRLGTGPRGRHRPSGTSRHLRRHHPTRATRPHQENGMKRPPVIPLDHRLVDAEHLARYATKVDTAGDYHNWTGACNNVGYPVFRLNGRQVYAHRLAWVIANRQDIPTGLTIDHLCRNQRCVNAAHLEVVTPAVNNERQPRRNATHCPQGHPYRGDNLYTFPDGRRACRTCTRESQARYAQRKKATA